MNAQRVQGDLEELILQERCDVTLNQVNSVFRAIKRKLVEGNNANPKEKYLVILLFAGHGILKDGQQTLVLNEFDSGSGFYKLFKAEDTIRKLSYATSLNSYFICIFACCRELFNPNTMKGCYDACKLGVSLSQSQVQLTFS